MQQQNKELPPIFLEHPLKWDQIEETSQQLFIEGIKTNNLSAWVDSLEPVMDCVLLIAFPASLVNPNAPPEAEGRVNVFVPKKVTQVNTPC